MQKNTQRFIGDSPLFHGNEHLITLRGNNPVGIDVLEHLAIRHLKKAEPDAVIYSTNKVLTKQYNLKYLEDIRQIETQKKLMKIPYVIFSNTDNELKEKLLADATTDKIMGILIDRENKDRSYLSSAFVTNQDYIVFIERHQSVRLVDTEIFGSKKYLSVFIQP